ncbi:MAG: hypothetical protein A3F16_05685 [Deltaproteobacteria bacterium RIFCSPHIGHO2_12_FULL_43_9]|nr:MAG: hypothetical protein A3F16_05685 [Deltaproteobacteria bacterium RIFCSPHIGHO2_12_FULL_43_9]
MKRTYKILVLVAIFSLLPFDAYTKELEEGSSQKLKELLQEHCELARTSISGSKLEEFPQEYSKYNWKGTDFGNIVLDFFADKISAALKRRVLMLEPSQVFQFFKTPPLFQIKDDEYWVNFEKENLKKLYTSFDNEKMIEVAAQREALYIVEKILVEELTASLKAHRQEKTIENFNDIFYDYYKDFSSHAFSEPSLESLVKLEKRLLESHPERYLQYGTRLGSYRAFNVAKKTIEAFYKNTDVEQKVRDAALFDAVMAVFEFYTGGNINLENEKRKMLEGFILNTKSPRSYILLLSLHNKNLNGTYKLEYVNKPIMERLTNQTPLNR